MNRRTRLERLEQDFRSVRPSANAVRAAMDRFRKTGELPEDVRLARAVTQWAETGINACEYDGDNKDQQAALIRAYINLGLHPGNSDVVMEGLYTDAVYSPEPARSIARNMLRIIAMTGRDPSTPVWKNLGWKVPKRTSWSMAMTLVGWPTAFVHRRHRPRTKLLTQKFLAFSELLGKDDVQIEEFFEAAEEFRATGQLPAEKETADAILWDAELNCYLQTRRTGEDCERLIAALRHYEKASPAKRAAALAEVQAAVVAGPQPGSPEGAGEFTQISKAMRRLMAWSMDGDWDDEDAADAASA